MTSIEYELATSERVTLAIYEIRAELVRMVAGTFVEKRKMILIK